MAVDIAVPAPEHHHPVETSALQRLKDHGPELITSYLQQNSRNGIPLIARDAAKKLFPEYNEDRTGHNRLVDAAASALADAVRRTLLASPPVAPANRLLIVTGAPASGKSVSASALQVKGIEMIHETILTSQWRAQQLLQEALQAKRLPVINLIYLDDPRLNVHRMIERARRFGRTVPLAYMAQTYSQVPRLVLDLHQEFAGQVQLLLANNSGKAGEVFFHQNIKKVVETTARYTVPQCLEIMDNELDQIHQAKAIPGNILQEAKLR